MKVTNELKTGIVVVAAVAVGVMFWLKTTNITSTPYKVKTSFSYADGIKPETIVKLSGIDVGRVIDIQFKYEPETRIEVTMIIDKKAKLREDSIAFISTSGMIGDAFIGITPGSADKPFVKEGATLVSEDPLEMRKLMKKMDSIAENLDKTLGEVKTLAMNVNGVVSENKPRIDNIFINLEKTAINFNEFSDDLKKHPWKLLSKK
jgi:phospholipid/cholesterol/gamma-HCH transport system substrate-binding protein